MIVWKHVRVCMRVHVPVYSFLTCLSANAFFFFFSWRFVYEWISQVFLAANTCVRENQTLLFGSVRVQAKKSLRLFSPKNILSCAV